MVRIGYMIKHYAWATNANGANFTRENPYLNSNSTENYIGTYVDDLELGSNNPKHYQWEQLDQAVNGISTNEVDVEITPTPQQAYHSNLRTLQTKVTLDGLMVTEVMTGEDKVVSWNVKKSAFDGEDIQVGSVASSTLQLKLADEVDIKQGDKLTVEIGILCGSSFEYTQVGVFYAQSIKIDTDTHTTEIEAFDDLFYTESLYETDVALPNNLRTIVADVLNKLNITAKSGTISQLPSISVTEKQLEKLTSRAILQNAAQLIGACGMMNRLGEFCFQPITSSSEIITPNDYHQASLKLDTESYQIGGITVTQKGADDKQISFSVGVSTGSQLKWENPFITQSEMLTWWNMYRTSFAHRSGVLSWKGSPFIEPAQMLRVRDVKNVNYTFYVLNLTLEFNGGLKSTIASSVKAKANTTMRKGGALTEKVNNVIDLAEKANQNAMEAVVSADGKNTNFYGELANGFPQNPKIGDLFFAKDGDKLILFQWDGQTWNEIISDNWQSVFEEQLQNELNLAKEEINEELIQHEIRQNDLDEKLSEHETVMTQVQDELSEHDELMKDVENKIANVEITNQEALTASQEAKESAEQALIDSAIAKNQADDAVVKALEGKTLAETVQSDLATANTAIVNAQNEASNALEKFNKLSIGSRNLLRNSDFLKVQSNGLPTSWSFYQNVTNSPYSSRVVSISDLRGISKGVRFTPSVHEVTTNGQHVGIYQNESILKGIQADSEYTVSLFVKKNTDVEAKLRFEISNYNESVRVVVRTPIETIQSSDWEKHSYTFLTTEETNAVRVYVGLSMTGLANKPDVTMAGLKLERGNKATDWSKNPEDVDVEIVALENGLATKVNQTTFDTTRNALENRMSVVEHTTSGITSTVSTITDLTVSTNLLRNSTWNSGTNYWSGLTISDTGNHRILPPESDKPTSSILALNYNKNSSNYYSSEKINANKNETYVVSLDVRVSDITNTSKNLICLRAFVDDNTFYTATSTINSAINNFHLTANTWTRISCEFTTHPNAEIQFIRIITGGGGGTATTRTEFREIMVTRKVDGKQQGAWVPSMYDASTTVLTQIQQLSDRIETQAVTVTSHTTQLSTLTQTANSLSTRVSSVENGLTTATSSITQLSSNINLRVEKSKVINQINVSTEGILIDGNKVHITGSTTIDNAVIGTAQIKDLAITNAKIGEISANKITSGMIETNLIAPMSVNLLKNSQFSNINTKGWSVYKTPNSNHPTTWTGSGTYTNSAGVRYLLINANSLTLDVTNSESLYLLQDVKAYGGVAYSASIIGYLTRDSVGGALEIGFNDSSGTRLETRSTPLTANSAFTQYKLENCVAPSGTATVRFQVRYNGKSRLYFTQAMLNTGSKVALYQPSADFIIVDSDVIVNGSVISSKIATNAVTADKINVANLSAINSNLGTLTAGTIDASVVTVKNLDAGKITTGNLTADRMSANILTAIKAKVGSLSAISADIGTITAGTINGSNMNILNLNASNISSGTLNAARIGANSITADKLAANALQVGLSNWSNSIRISPTAINLYSGSTLQGTIDSYGFTLKNVQAGLSLYDGSNYVGQIHSNHLEGNANYRGLTFDLETKGNYMSWAYKKNASDTTYTIALSYSPNGGSLTKGFVFNDNVKINGNIINPQGGNLKFQNTTVDGAAYSSLTATTGKSGLLYGANWLYFMHDGYVYDFDMLRRLYQFFNQFKGSNISIPTKINNDGTVQTWVNKTL